MAAPAVSRAMPAGRCDALLAERPVEKLGGSSLSPVIEVPEVGLMRTMKDPQGAMFTGLPLSPERAARGNA